MAKFKLEIDLDNAAFADDPTVELRRILIMLSHKLDAGFTDGASYIRDVNGNMVGKAEFKGKRA